MIVKCPQCGGANRILEVAASDRVIRYLCGSCQDIVRIDLDRDEIPSSSSAGSFRTMDRRKKVLVADDTETARLMASDLLRDEGYDVVTAGDGEEALRALGEEHPDLVVLDLLMPRVTGFEVLRHIRREERLKDTPVLVISGVYKGKIIDVLQDLGAEGFLDKEHLRDELAFRVNAILGSGEGKELA